MRTLTRLMLLSIAGTLILPGLAAARNGLGEAEPTANASAGPSASPQPEIHNGLDDATHMESSSGKVAKLGDAPARVKVESAQFCAKFSDATGTVSTETSNRFGQLSDNFANRDKKVTSDFANLTAKITQNRSEADARLAAKFVELNAKAVTADQKSAVAAYKLTVTTAVATRRAAVDAADAAFKAGLIDAIGDRQTQLQASAAAYKASVASAIAAAKVSCAAGMSPAAVRASFRTALEAARDKLENARMSATKVGPNVDTLKATRKAAVDKANSDLKISVKAALLKLKLVLGASVSPSPSASPATTPVHTP